MLLYQKLTKKDWKPNFQITLNNPGIDQWVLALMAYQIRAWVDGVVKNTKEQMVSQKK